MMNTIIRQSILSGMLVGIGVVINTMSENRYAYRLKLTA